MQQKDEYIKLIADLMDLRLQLIYLLQQQQSMSEDLKTSKKEIYRLERGNPVEAKGERYGRRL